MQPFFKSTRSVMPAIGAVMLLASLVSCAPSDTPAPSSSAIRTDEFAKLPDWSGVWRLRGSPALLDVEDGKAFVPGTRDYPPYTPDWEEKYKVDLIRAENQGNPDFPNPLVDTHTVYCATGMPHLIATPFDYEFALTPGMVWISADNETRRIYTDGRPYPPADEMWPTMMGWSIGRWEGQTLVIETTSARPGLWGDLTPVTFSGEAVFSERIRLVDADTLENRVSITDPVALTRPWTFTKHYIRQKRGTWAAEPEVCGHPGDRNPVVDGRLMTVLPGDKKPGR
jgi:hypothetical protein